jgi:hypothetical protein
MTKIFLASVLAIVGSACSSDEPAIDCEKSGLIINVDQITHATSCSSNDGSVQFSIIGGAEPYKLFLNGQAIESSGSINNLMAGVHSISVTDGNNCTFFLDNLSITAEDFSFTSTIQPNTSCSSGTGAFIIDVTGDNPPYSFKLGNVDFTTNNSFSGLKSGNHIIAVRDNNNCIVDLNVLIPQGFTGTSWANDIKPILEKECAISGCHNGTSRSNDFSNYNSAKSFAASIKSKTQDRSMPFDGTLTQNQINLIACWVNEGALLN